MYTTVSARLDARLKDEAEGVLSALGISHSAAISALYSQIVLQQGLPFDLKLPRQSSRFGLSYWELRDAVRRIAEAQGAAKVWLFGPYAEGTADAASSVELRVDAGEDAAFDPEAFSRNLEQELGVSVHVSPTQNLSRRFLSSIKESEELIYER